MRKPPSLFFKVLLIMAIPLVVALFLLGWVLYEASQ
jgi:hypothetical protein